MKLTALCQTAIESWSIPEKTAKHLLDQRKKAAKAKQKTSVVLKAPARQYENQLAINQKAIPGIYCQEEGILL
jgi:hypothetical protein